MKKTFVRFLKNKIFISIASVIALLVCVSVYKKANAGPNFESSPAMLGDVVESVSVTGTVSPINKADLAFEKSGVLARVYVKVGDAVKKGDIIASLSGANEKAALLSAQATLADMTRPLTEAELNLEKSSLASANTDLDNAKKNAINASSAGFAKAQGALVNYVDGFFSNPQSVNPSITIPTDSQSIANSINSERVAVTGVMNKWSKDLSSANDANDIISKSTSYLSQIKSFFNDLSIIVNRLSSGGSGLSASSVSSYTASMNTAMTTLDSAIDSVSSASASLSASESALQKSQSSYNLKLSGNSSESITAQIARVQEAKASVNQGVIISPIDGIITKADPTVGEFVAAGTAGFAVQNKDFKIEAFVPEADIAKVSLDDIASTTLDAYGQSIDFPSKVAMIDPAETVIEGVPTYKVTLVFINPDERIRSGMTANLTIFTHMAKNVLYVPFRAVIDDNGLKSVRIVDTGGKTYATSSVEVGLKGSDGNIEIKSGLIEGQKVVTYVK